MDNRISFRLIRRCIDNRNYPLSIVGCIFLTYITTNHGNNEGIVFSVITIEGTV
jgi:hypothetical protein